MVYHPNREITKKYQNFIFPLVNLHKAMKESGERNTGGLVIFLWEQFLRKNVGDD